MGYDDRSFSRIIYFNLLVLSAAIIDLMKPLFLSLWTPGTERFVTHAKLQSAGIKGKSSI